MNGLTKYLVSELLDGKKVTAVFGGGFKPPTKGHFGIVQKALEDYKEIDEFIVYVGGKPREGITQEQALQVWQIYGEILGDKVKFIPSKNPIGDVLQYPLDHPDEMVYYVIGAREGNEEDMADVQSRTKKIAPNTQVKLIVSPEVSVSGTNARKALKNANKTDFFTYLPDSVPDGEKEEIYNILEPNILKESTIPSINILEKVTELTQHMINKGYKIRPLPKLILVSNDTNNAEDFLGKTAYYNPQDKSITLYTYGRHPKDIVRSFSHEMIHHMQNLEGRLGNISTTNTLEDDNLNDLEKEANLKGTMEFRNWTDGLQEGQLTEGRYDKLTNSLSRLAFQLIKSGYESGEDVDQTFMVGPSDEDPDVVSDDFEFDFVVQSQYTDDTYTVDGGANAGYDEDGDEITPLLSISFEIPKNPDWKTVVFDLKDVIRHELEHLTQDGPNTRSGKYLPDDSALRNMIDSELLPKSAYFKLEKEVDAMLQGLYLKAKKSRKPYLEVIDDYLDKQPITQEERKDILDLWAKRAKALSLPFNQSIKEVGEATLKPYEWELLSTIRGDYTYGFTTDSGIEYRVFIESLDFDDEKTGELVKGIEIGFIAGEAGKEKSDKTVINRGEVFRVMATVANIIQTSIKLTPEFKQTQAIVYNPASKEGEGVTGNQRDKLYQAFIKKAFPRASFERNGTAIVSKLDPPKEKP